MDDHDEAGRDEKSARSAQPARLPLLTKEAEHPCFECASCCRYVAIEIDPPRTNRQYDYVVWYLHHQGISVYVDWEGSWYLKTDARCRNLTASGTCAIYANRPAICRDFEWSECEKNVPDEPADKWLFESVDGFLAWLARQRPAAHRRFLEYQATRGRERSEDPLTRVRVTTPQAP